MEIPVHILMENIYSDENGVMRMTVPMKAYRNQIKKQSRDKTKVCLDAFLRQQNYTEKYNLGSGNYAEVFKVTTKNEKNCCIEGNWFDKINELQEDSWKLKLKFCQKSNIQTSLKFIK